MLNVELLQWKQEVLQSATERFERRLTDESGTLRVDMARMETRLVRWMFVFWLGQLGANLAVTAFVLRAIEPR
jgi:hypothetical protein